MVTSSDGGNRRRTIADVPVRRKLLAGFGAVISVCLVLTAVIFLTVARLGAAHEEIVDTAVARTTAADQLRTAASEMRAAQQAYVIGVGDGRPAFEAAMHRFEVRLDALRSFGATPTERALVDKITTGYQTFIVTDQMIWDAVQSGEAELASNLTLGAEGLAFGFMADDAAAFAEHAEADRVDAIEVFERTSQSALWLAGALATAAVVLTVIAAAYITRLIRTPLQRVQEAAERAADGDLDAEADIDSDDEIGRLARAFNGMLEKLRLREQTLLADHRRQELTTRIHRALDMAEEESSAIDVVALTIAEVIPDRSAELLLADNSKSNLEQVAVAGPDGGGPGCPVGSPFSCVAVRSGSPVTFPSSAAIDACPHLRTRGGSPCSAVCVPVSFMGRALGVIHAVDRESATPTAAEIEGLTTLSMQAGARIGMLRTMVRTQEQAATDSLTGLMNRRTFQARVRHLRRSERSFTLVMADLDHFKRLNDTYGHETGDRALRTFSEVVRGTIRADDLFARWGGEEFALALPDLEPTGAREVLDRVRVQLAARLATSDLPSFTASFGIVDAGGCETLEAAIRLADDALYEAKAAGRNCSVIASEDASATATPRVAAPAPAPATGVLARIFTDDDEH